MAVMGLNNWLVLDDGDDGRALMVAFRWGEVREHEYRLGETVFWPEGARPSQARGEHFVPGLANGAPVAAHASDFVPIYYLIRIIEDLIVSIEASDEKGFAAAEALLLDLGIPQ